jgi:hypothetical protein
VKYAPLSNAIPLHVLAFIRTIELCEQINV